MTKTEEELLEFIDRWSFDLEYELDQFAKEINTWAKGNGFWDEERNFGEMIALAHSELSEALEAHRAGNPPDKHLPQFDSVTVELADTIIRILDAAEGLNLPIAQAVIHKMAYNKTRPRKNGKQY